MSELIERVNRCSECGKPMDKLAHDTGFEWLLHWACGNVKCAFHYIDYDIVYHNIDWPFGEELASPKDLEAIGFEIV